MFFKLFQRHCLLQQWGCLALDMLRLLKKFQMEKERQSMLKKWRKL